MISKNKIFDSFEEFIAVPLSILKNRIIQITGFKTDFVSQKSIDIELSNNAVHINCINNEGAYNLLSNVIYKRKLNKKRELEKEIRNYENKKSTVFIELANS